MKSGSVHISNEHVRRPCIREYLPANARCEAVKLLVEKNSAACAQTLSPESRYLALNKNSDIQLTEEGLPPEFQKRFAGRGYG